MKAILASQNKNKIKEFNDILKRYDLEVVSRDDAGLPMDDVPENGSTFEENSMIKASAIRKMIVDGGFSEYLDSPIIADDSGLMVEALGGEPGVYSSRYAGPECNTSYNNAKLLANLKDKSNRDACFVTVITMLYPDGKSIVARGECHGEIATEPRGDKGFGYDPLFVPSGYDKTFSELGPDEKNKISHRARALEKLESLLK